MGKPKQYQVTEMIQSPGNEPAQVYWGQGDAVHVLAAVAQIMDHDRNRDLEIPIEVQTVSIKITKVPVE